MDIRSRLRSGAPTAIGRVTVATPTIHLNGLTPFRVEITFKTLSSNIEGEAYETTLSSDIERGARASDPASWRARGSRPMPVPGGPTPGGPVNKEQRRRAYAKRCAIKVKKLEEELRLEKKARLAAETENQELKKVPHRPTKAQSATGVTPRGQQQCPAGLESEPVLRAAAACSQDPHAHQATPISEHLAQNDSYLGVITGPAWSERFQQQCPAGSESEPMLWSAVVHSQDPHAHQVTSRSKQQAQKRSYLGGHDSVAAGELFQEQCPTGSESEPVLRAASTRSQDWPAHQAASRSEQLAQKRSYLGGHDSVAASELFHEQCPTGSESEPVLRAASTRSQDWRAHQAASRSEQLAQKRSYLGGHDSAAASELFQEQCPAGSEAEPVLRAAAACSQDPHAHQVAADSELLEQKRSSSLAKTVSGISNREWRSMIDQFFSGDSLSLDLPSSLNSGQRREAHKMCARMGLSHTSAESEENGRFVQIRHFGLSVRRLDHLWQKVGMYWGHWIPSRDYCFTSHPICGSGKYSGFLKGPTEFALKVLNKLAYLFKPDWGGVRFWVLVRRERTSTDPERTPVTCRIGDRVVY
jgi:hypothetical protein